MTEEHLPAFSVCPICGNSFDPVSYQVLVAGDDHAFDSVECAIRARDWTPPRIRRELEEGTAPTDLPMIARGRGREDRAS